MARVDICIACPVCAEQGYNTTRDYWLHKSRFFGDFASCNGRLQIDEYANVRCKKCLKKAKITQMMFKCPSDRHSFKVATVEGLSEVFSSSAQMVNAVGNQWFISVIKHIG